MKHKLMIGLLFLSPQLFAADKSVSLEKTFSNVSLVVVVFVAVFAIYASIKAYEVVVGNLEEKINEEKKI